MKTKVNSTIIPILFLAILTVLMVLPISTAVRSPEYVTITMAESQGPFDPGPPFTGTNTGEWSASGAFTDSGTVVSHYQLMPMHASMLVTSHLTGAGGSIIMQMILVGHASHWISPTVMQHEGRWVIVGGTGQYANSGLAGQGTVIVVIDVELAQAGEVSNFVTAEGMVELKT